MSERLRLCLSRIADDISEFESKLTTDFAHLKDAIKAEGDIEFLKRVRAIVDRLTSAPSGVIGLADWIRQELTEGDAA